MLRKVAILAYPGVQILDVVGPHEVFDIASRIAKFRRGTAAYEIRIVAESSDAVRSSSGLSLVPHETLRAGREVDTLIVAGGTGSRAAAENPRLLQWVVRAAASARRIASVCTGAFVLAAAGLLAGRRVVTHWASTSELAQRHPSLTVDPDPIFIQDGPVWTSAGVTAGMDLALALVEEDLGREIALEVARYLVLFVRRPGGQSQFSAQLTAQSAERKPLRDLQAFIVDHPEGDLRIPVLAARVGMSVRNFARAFKAETGETPASYVERVRVEAARRMLETTAMSVDEIARRAGFGTPEAMRRAFRRRLRVSPAAYRVRFRSPTREEQSHGNRHRRLRESHRARRGRSVRGPEQAAGRARALRRQT